MLAEAPSCRDAHRQRHRPGAECSLPAPAHRDAEAPSCWEVPWSWGWREWTLVAGALVLERDAFCRRHRIGMRAEAPSCWDAHGIGMLAETPFNAGTLVLERHARCWRPSIGMLADAPRCRDACRWRPSSRRDAHCRRPRIGMPTEASSWSGTLTAGALAAGCALRHPLAGTLTAGALVLE